MTKVNLRWTLPLSNAAKQALELGTLKFVVISLQGVSYELLEGSYIEEDGTLKRFPAVSKFGKVTAYPFNSRASYLNAQHFSNYLRDSCVS